MKVLLLTTNSGGDALSLLRGYDDTTEKIQN